MPVSNSFIDKLAELSMSGCPFASVTVAGVVGSAPANVGSKALITAQGLMYGTLGGGKVERKAIEHAIELLVTDSRKTCDLIEWNLQRDIGMTCGGVVKLLFECHNIHRWRIVIFGAGHVAQALIRALLLIDCIIVCIDCREEWLSKLPSAPQLQTIRIADSREYVTQLLPNDYIVCVTMGHQTDVPIVQSILHAYEPKPASTHLSLDDMKLPFPYLGVIGSQAKRKVLIRELTAAGVPGVLLDQLRCPIGLPLGTNHPGEIAISVTAELLQVRDEHAQRATLESCSEKAICNEEALPNPTAAGS